MGSLVYKINNMEFDTKKLNGNTSVNITDQTMRAYKKQAIQFGKWCKDEFKSRTPEDCAEHIQDYADWLAAQGKSASTIHTYLAGVCRYFQIPMDKINKPRRIVSENTRSRGEKDVDKRSDARREASPRLYDFASAVGIRRREYRCLLGSDLVTDESGYLCVQVRRGKGGKHQDQRILPGDEMFIRSFFSGKDEPVFTKKEMTNKIDLHHLRALQAQRAYQYYLNRLEKEPDYRKQLTQEIEKRWKRWNKDIPPEAQKNLRFQKPKKYKTREPKIVEGYYIVRGKNRTLARKNGLPIKYDRLAVMAVSIYHLSHWRSDVTVCNYLLAV